MALLFQNPPVIPNVRIGVYQTPRFRLSPQEVLCASKHRYSQGMTGRLGWVFPKIGIAENGWFIVETPIKMDDLGVISPPIFGNTLK